MYRHIRNFSVPSMQGRYSTVGTLLDILEPYIPFNLTEENFNLFIETVTATENPSLRFVHKAKLDFVVALRAMRRPWQWDQTLATCESIRALKEKLLSLREKVPQL